MGFSKEGTKEVFNPVNLVIDSRESYDLFVSMLRAISEGDSYDYYHGSLEILKALGEE